MVTETKKNVQEVKDKINDSIEGFHYSSNESIRKNMGSAYDSLKHQKFNESAWRILSTFAEAIMNGARFYDILKTPEINVGCSISANSNKTEFQDCSAGYDEKIVNFSSTLDFKYLEIPFTKLGYY